jgi:S-adenosylmethionine decarboxylase
MNPPLFKKHRMQGEHLLVDFFGVAKEKLRDRKKLMGVLCAALKKNGFSIIRKTGSHKFEGGGQGVTGFVLLAQSHAAFHSYPEWGYIALDIYSCGGYDPGPIARAMEEHLDPKKVRRIFQRRGGK